MGNLYSSPRQVEVMGVSIPGQFALERNVEVLGNRYDYVVNFKSHYFDIFKTFRERPEATKAKHEYNMHRFNGDLYEEDTQWKGGSFDDLMDESKDFTVYEEVRKKLSASEVWSKIVTQFNDVNTRRRKRNAYDGEYDHDKRWDSEPFSKREPAKTKARIVKLRVEAGFSSSVGSGTISQFSAFIAAIVNMLEQNGVLCEIIACKTAHGFLEDYSNSLYRFEYKVKEADEYLPVQSIMKVFSPNWYRRINFALISASAEFAGKEVDGGLGTPYAFGKVWAADGDTINIFSVPDLTQQHNILEHLVSHLTSASEPKP